ncbi:MAG: radical SAM protein [Nitrospirae bacterium]|nr:radical SAM protein [Nitrospirota bacterium]
MKKQRYGHISIPLKRVHVELTNVCEFNCVFCPKSEMKRQYGYMKTDFAKNIITELTANNICEKITFHVMGEPTLHPDFFEILEHAKKEGADIGLTTNGAGLGGKTGNRLLDYRFHQIDISLQTPDEQSFALRKAGRLSFESYLNGILSFFSSYQRLHNDTIFKFRFLNTRFPKKEIEKRTGLPIRVISSTDELRETFRYWAGRIYDMIGVGDKGKEESLKRISSLSAYRWNVCEVYPNVFFETYILNDWGHAFDKGAIRNGWAGYCFGMQDHFAILYNGDVTLCCMDFDGHTVIGNLNKSSLKEVLSSEWLGRILNGFRKFRIVHPYCKRCLGSRTVISWLTKPVMSIAGLTLLKPLLYRHTKLY